MSNEIAGLRHFGPFRLDVERKVLWHDQQPVTLPLKEIEVLCVLTENAGQVVTKNELLEKVWGDSFVEESNLSRHIYLLRKTLKEYGLDEELIQTVPRRGYRFSGEVKKGELVIERHSISRTLIEEVNTQRPLLSGRRIAVATGLLFVIVATGFAIWKYQRTTNSSARIKSIAILPLRPLSNSDQDRTLSLGTTDALISRMGSLNLITVRSVSPSSIGSLDALETGKTLDVDAVLEGSLQRDEGRIRVTLRLLSVHDGRQIWSGEFNETDADIFKLQDAVSTQVAQRLSLQLDPEKKQLLTKRYTENAEAYHAYMRGRFFFDRRDAPNFEKSIAEFERAIAFDPNYALAYSGLADVYGRQVNLNEPVHTLQRKARLNAEKALELDETLAEAHTSLAAVKRSQDWDWEGSEKHFKRAIELDPLYVNARQWYALLLTTLGRRDEALVQIEQARQLDPLSKVVLLNYYQVQLSQNDSNALRSTVEKIVALEESQVEKLKTLSVFYERIGDYSKAIESGEELLLKFKHNSTSVIASLAIAYTRMGKESKAKAMFAYLEQRPKADTGAVYQLATIYSELGNEEKAIELLQQSFENHDARMLWIMVEPRLKRLRDHPRFVEILRKMRLAY